ncbi:hypothetical protein SAMN04488105_109163 [Salipiger thiooxidans]|uniref:DUF5666 domain-containing protein n=1 Tax=Salipiger thiooxidans TaxID=282683 RepID=A0A1G7GS29_9RHOB|nr:hypothetical protein [Salipiger thiooxidans]SDE90759.1 hypothetical protein SAMN04488105_109163 [Salipiger thiooxidans]
MTFDRRNMIALVLGAGTLIAASSWVHHGIESTENGEIELTGQVTQAQLETHDERLVLLADGTAWTVDIGPLIDARSAGLTPEMLAPGNELTVLGERDGDVGTLELRASAVIFGSTRHDLGSRSL